MVEILHRYKHTYPDGSIVQIVIWDIPRTHDRPDGIRYRLAYIPAQAAGPAVLYDNHHPKGHHKRMNSAIGIN